jgi:hypothetical protein
MIRWVRRLICAALACAAAIIPAAAAAGISLPDGRGSQQAVPSRLAGYGAVEPGAPLGVIQAVARRELRARLAAGSDSYLGGVAAVSRKRAWAAGSSCLKDCATGTGAIHPLIARWDGRAWSRVASPSPGSVAVLLSVAVAAARRGWAVGEYCTGRCTAVSVLRTLIVSWEGRRWSLVPSPHPSRVVSSLSAVSALSVRSAWAVGEYVTRQYTFQTLILHWNGTRWSRVPSPGRPDGSWLTGVDAVSAADVWAVGYQATGQNSQAPLIEHWNGRTWRVLPGRYPASSFSMLSAVAGASPSSVWAVGTYCVAKCAQARLVSRTLVMHWDGRRWSVIPSPSPDQRGANELNAVATAGGQAWAAGESCTTQCALTGHASHTLILRWNGRAWTRSVTRDSARRQSLLYGIAAASPASAWAVGYADGRVLGLHWNGHRWSASTRW